MSYVDPEKVDRARRWLAASGALDLDQLTGTDVLVRSMSSINFFHRQEWHIVLHFAFGGSTSVTLRECNFLFREFGVELEHELWERGDNDYLEVMKICLAPVHPISDSVWRRCVAGQIVLKTRIRANGAEAWIDLSRSNDRAVPVMYDLPPSM